MFVQIYTWSLNKSRLGWVNCLGHDLPVLCLKTSFQACSLVWLGSIWVDLAITDVASCIKMYCASHRPFCVLMHDLEEWRSRILVVKSLLALVPKKKFNHIISFSLFTSLDKVIVEVLSQKFFQKHSRNIICVQAAFVKDRQILDVFGG